MPDEATAMMSPRRLVLGYLVLALFGVLLMIISANVGASEPTLDPQPFIAPVELENPSSDD